MEPDRFDYIETPAGVDPVDADEALLEKTGLEVIGFDAVDEEEEDVFEEPVVVDPAAGVTIDVAVRHRDHDPVRAYLREIGKVPLLTARGGDLARQARRARRSGGQAGADRGQPAPRRLGREALRRVAGCCSST